MTAPRPSLPPRLIAGLLLVLLGLVSWVLYGVAAGSENRSYDPHGAPPDQISVVRGHTYWLAVPGGASRLRELGAEPSALHCTTTGPGPVTSTLAVTAAVGQDGDTKFVNRIGSFVAPRTGQVHVSCAGAGTVYVENAADAGFDWSGLWLVLASAALVVGLPLTLSGLRRPARADVESAAGAREYDEVE